MEEALIINHVIEKGWRVFFEPYPFNNAYRPLHELVLYGLCGGNAELLAYTYPALVCFFIVLLCMALGWGFYGIIISLTSMFTFGSMDTFLWPAAASELCIGILLLVALLFNRSILYLVAAIIAPYFKETGLMLVPFFSYLLFTRGRYVFSFLSVLMLPVYFYLRPETAVVINSHYLNHMAKMLCRFFLM